MSPFSLLKHSVTRAFGFVDFPDMRHIDWRLALSGARSPATSAIPEAEVKAVAPRIVLRRGRVALEVHSSTEPAQRNRRVL
jgi:hypothetical protein